MRVCYFGTYRQRYSRNKIMIAALRRAGIEVEECHATLWQGIRDRVNTTTGGWKKPAFWWRLVRTYTKLLWRFAKVKDFDVLMVGYPGQLDVFLAKPLAALRRKPLVWDVFMSIYLIARERELNAQSPRSVALLRRIEARALKKPDLLIQDTAAYVRWFEEEYGIDPARFRLVPTGADDRIFAPAGPDENGSDRPFTVLYYGTYIPNHGVQRIVQAAAQLKEHPEIRFKMIGEGPDKATAEAFAEKHHLENVTFLDWMDQNTLLKEIKSSSVCLGAFGDTPQSLMTVQNKIYEGLAMGKPVITGDSPAVQSTFTQWEDLLICNRDPNSLAQAILTLKENRDLRQKIAAQGLKTYQTHYSLEKLGSRLRDYLSEVIFNNHD